MKEEKKDNWICSRPEELPDFIIGGAMKSGTTTLHHLLNSHPDVMIPKGELGFFDIDNILEHSDYNFYNKEKDIWFGQDLNSDPELYWNWYLNKFNRPKGGITGEDSTTYLASTIAAERISKQKKKIKLIFILRQPTERAYSQYYHFVRSGRATHSFEDTLKYYPNSVLKRSLYMEQLKSYYSLISKDQIKIIVFEDFIQNISETYKEICDFLNIDSGRLDINTIETHQNKSYFPKYLKLSVLKTRLFRGLGNERYISFLPNKDYLNEQGIVQTKNLLEKLYTRINPKVSKKPPKISSSVKEYLDSYFKYSFSGINELVDMDLISKWFKVK